MVRGIARFFMTMGVFGVIAFYLMILAGIVGWVMNIIALVHLFGADVITGTMLLRIVGIFVLPLGGVLGWL